MSLRLPIRVLIGILIVLVILMGYVFWPRLPAVSPAELLPADFSFYSEFLTKPLLEFVPHLSGWRKMAGEKLFPRGVLAAQYHQPGYEVTLFLPGGGGRFQILVYLLDARHLGKGVFSIPVLTGRVRLQEKKGWIVLSFSSCPGGGSAVWPARIKQKGNLASVPEFQEWLSRVPSRPDFLKFFLRTDPGHPGGFGRLFGSAADFRLEITLGGWVTDYSSLSAGSGGAALELEINRPELILGQLETLEFFPPLGEFRDWVDPEILEFRASIDELYNVLSIPVPQGTVKLGFDSSSPAKRYMSNLTRQLGSLADWKISGLPGPGKGLVFSYFNLLGFSLEAENNRLWARCPPGVGFKSPETFSSRSGEILLTVKLKGFKDRIVPGLSFGLAPAELLVLKKGLQKLESRFNELVFKADLSGSCWLFALQLR